VPIRPLGELDIAWVNEQLERATVLARKHGDPPTSQRPSLAALDAMWAEAIATLDHSDGDGANAIINLVGVGIGQHLVDELGLSWSVCEDEYGTDLAVHGEPGNVIVTPTSFVAKRWDTKTSTFVVEVIPRMIDDIRRMRPSVH
jgi:hypothetical protein